LTEAVLVSKLGTGLDIKLDIKLGTVLNRKCLTVLVLDIKLGSKLGTGLGSRLRIELEKGGLGMKLAFKLEIVNGTDLWIVLGASFGYKLGSRLGTELGERVSLIESILES
jgi:hypothetical protein